MKGIFHLNGTVKNYDWGGFSFLPRLLHLDNPQNKPFAEYWVGTHGSGRTTVLTGGDNNSVLEEITGPLPYLFKILDVREMLSIQVHPSRESAALGFEDENRRGIALEDPRRNFRDPNEKPEFMVAIGDFWLLHGFKPLEELHDVLINVSELSELLPVLHNKGYAGLYSLVMKMSQAEVNRILEPLRLGLVNEQEKGALEKATEDYWAEKAMRSFTRDGNIDRGIFSIYFFNLLKLRRGQGIYQPPGVPHAYLEGRNVEIMGNSDNVLRGGLTNKPIAIDELLKNTRCEPLYPNIIEPEGSGALKTYRIPTDLFHLSSIEVPAGGSVAWKTSVKEILMIVEGEGRITAGETSLPFGEGSPSVLISGMPEVRLDANKAILIFRAQG
jgi:mannose-6-phosphate isomerase